MWSWIQRCRFGETTGCSILSGTLWIIFLPRRPRNIANRLGGQRMSKIQLVLSIYSGFYACMAVEIDCYICTLFLSKGVSYFLSVMFRLCPRSPSTPFPFRVASTLVVNAFTWSYFPLTPVPRAMTHPTSDPPTSHTQGSPPPVDHYPPLPAGFTTGWSETYKLPFYVDTRGPYPVSSWIHPYAPGEALGSTPPVGAHVEDHHRAPEHAQQEDVCPHSFCASL